MKHTFAGTAIILAFATLTACSKPAGPGNVKYSPQSVNTAAAPADAKAGAPEGGHPDNPVSGLGVPQLAYSYTYGFQGPAKGIETLRQADQAACERSGPVECQLLASTSNNDRESDTVNKSLELRVSPAWLKRWKSGLDSSVSNAGARVTGESVNSEDLSLQIVDVSARLKNKQALRDRLQAIIRTGNGKIAELIEAESQLSQVQADIESAQSQLAVMQSRVATIHLELNYSSDSGAASNSVFAPVAEAWTGVLRNMMVMVSILITLAAFLIPVAIVAGPVAWWFLKRRKARKTLKG